MRIDEFILARIAEDEAVARAAAGGPAPERWSTKEEGGTLAIRTSIGSMGWYFGGGSGVWQCDDPYDDCGEYRVLADREAAHITQHDPARVLAECEAKRRIVELHPPEPRYVEVQAMSEAEPREVYAGTYIPTELRLLAAVYAIHPDFDPAWRL